MRSEVNIEVLTCVTLLGLLDNIFEDIGACYMSVAGVIYKHFQVSASSAGVVGKSHFKSNYFLVQIQVVEAYKNLQKENEKLQVWYMQYVVTYNTTNNGALLLFPLILSV